MSAEVGFLLITGVIMTAMVVGCTWCLAVFWRHTDDFKRSGRLVLALSWLSLALFWTVGAWAILTS